jgi:hypothetical protein
MDKMCYDLDGISPMIFFITLKGGYSHETEKFDHHCGPGVWKRRT